MSFAFIHTLTQSLPYYADPTHVFAALCQDKTNTLLLESAEIHSKNSLKSLLVIQPALKITCHGLRVTFCAKTQNGVAVLHALMEKLQCHHEISAVTESQFSVIFPKLDKNLDEDNKLHTSTCFDALRALLSLYQHSEVPVLLGGLFAYDLVAQFIPMDNIQLQEDGLDCPDYCFYLAEHQLTLDHQLQQAQLHSFCFAPQYQTALQQQADQIIQKFANIEPHLHYVSADTTLTTNLDDVQFKQIIQVLKQHLYQGDVFQIVPSRRFSLACPNTLASYRQLKHTNPSPYMFFMQDEDFTLFGASPESALKYTQQTRQLEIYPIAGSRPRGFYPNGQIDPELDARLELELRLDQKELAEHLMLVDLARNDIARVCETGTRQVADLMQVDRYSHIMHLVSRVVGKLRPEFDALHAYQACMNMGTLTGAPKIKAMQLLYQVEQQKRHSYGGAVGYLASNGDLDTCIVIRSAFVQQGIAYIQAGCGEVLDSDPQKEADETRHKAQAVINAIVQTHQTPRQA
ncbi:anthranilate synthase component 1 [Pasteurella multocida]|uniref:anthranilate synthase component 1 n=1 Tax=Pasteurella multocida TaxID=747 RepID=UPI00244BC53F|nr:anthranilate synthase component 1 [Pasteurella multocida]MDH3003576.1 anthranilate synthase component I [Pasteurella multocida]